MKLKKLLNEIGVVGGIVEMKPIGGIVSKNPVQRKQEVVNDTPPSDEPEINSDQLKEVLQKISEYNKLREKISCSKNIMEAANALHEISTHSESLILRELKKQQESSGKDDAWLHKESVTRHCKQLKQLSESFIRESKKAYESVRSLESLYEDIGKLVEVYFDIND
jgi:hypothetical protein